MTLSSRDKSAVRISLVAWVVCGGLALVFETPFILMIAVAVTYVCGQAVLRVVPRKADTSAADDDQSTM